MGEKENFILFSPLGQKSIIIYPNLGINTFLLVLNLSDFKNRSTNTNL